MKDFNIEQYRQIETDVWQFFKKYFNTDDYSEYTKDATALEEKYKKDPRMYCFMLALLRVHATEMQELKDLREKKT